MRNIYNDIAANVNTVDTSDYPITHPLHSKKNAKLLWKFKDECNSLHPQEFIERRSKMYSLKLLNGSIKITAKALSSSHVLKNFKYTNCLYLYNKFVSGCIQNNNVTEARRQDLRSLQTMLIGIWWQEMHFTWRGFYSCSWTF